MPLEEAIKAVRFMFSHAIRLMFSHAIGKLKVVTVDILLLLFLCTIDLLKMLYRLNKSVRYLFRLAKN